MSESRLRMAGWRTWMCAAVALAGTVMALAAEPATRPAAPDDTIDWLLSQGTTAPSTAAATGPASQPASPLTGPAADRGARRAVVTLSDGEKIRGDFATTRDKPIRVWDAAEKEYRDIAFALIKSLEAQVLWERDQPERVFKESGSDIKVMTGKTYPARELVYTVTLLNDQTVKGGIVAPLYLVGDHDEKLLELNKRQKGPVGNTLKQLVYVKSLTFE